MISAQGARSAATRLLDEARSEPRSALQRGRILLQEIDADDHEARSIALRALAIAARLGSTIDESIDFGEKALIEAERSGQPSLRSEALMTLSGAMAIAGDNERALVTLESAYEGTSGQLQAAIASQEGAIRQRLGETRLAMECYGRALPVFREHEDFTSVAMTLNNVAMLRIDSGDVTGAKRDLEEVRALDLSLGHGSEAANADHNLGIVASRMGDIPEALRLFDSSEKRLTELAGSAAEVRVSRVEVLLSAGLIREALGMALDIASALHQTGFVEDEAEARLVGAQAALLVGDLDSALRWADIAAQMFDQQGRAIWAASARLVGIQAQNRAGLFNAELVQEARRIAEVLETEEQMIPAFNARLTAGRMGLDLGHTTSAREDLERVSPRRAGPVELRLQARLARALLRLSYGDRRGADAAARAGMGLLDDYQAALGASDIRTGVERHGAELGELGLRLAFESANPRRAFAWMERTRARALRHRPVTPSDDRAQADDLAELRRVSAELRSAEGEAARDLRRHERDLQDSVRNRGRLARGEGSKASMTVSDLVKALGDRTLVEFASLDGRLRALTVRNGRFSMRELGSEPAVLGELESLRFTMRRLARGRGNASTELARQVAARLDGMLFGNLRTGAGPLVIVPTPALHSMPWAALPTFEGRAFTVAPSAELWWRAARRRRRPGSVVVAAGPDLAHAGAEASEVAGLYPGVGAVDSDGATVDRLRTLLDRAATGHIACHASFEVDNPMFSSLRLTDGDLNVYDLERMRRVPALVVLSACDSGFSDTHPGEELMGLSSALLSLGARSLVASVGLVPDSEATRELMVGLHRGLISGLGPAEALNRARGSLGETTAGYVAAASFVSIGAG